MFKVNSCFLLTPPLDSFSFLSFLSFYRRRQSWIDKKTLSSCMRDAHWIELVYVNRWRVEWTELEFCAILIRNFHSNGLNICIGIAFNVTFRATRQTNCVLSQLTSDNFSDSTEWKIKYFICCDAFASHKPSRITWVCRRCATQKYYLLSSVSDDRGWIKAQTINVKTKCNLLSCDMSNQLRSKCWNCTLKMKKKERFGCQPS